MASHEDEMLKALEADGEKLCALTGGDHGPWSGIPLRSVEHPFPSAHIEAVARAICVADNVDPELVVCGMGVLLPAGELAPAWKARLLQATAAIRASYDWQELNVRAFFASLEEKNMDDIQRAYIRGKLQNIILDDSAAQSQLTIPTLDKIIDAVIDGQYSPQVAKTLKGQLGTHERG